MTSGVKDTGIIFGSKLILLLLAIATQSCLAWTLGPEGRGAYAVCLLFATVLSLAFVIGCDYAGVYYVASGKLNLAEGVLYSTILGCAGSGVAVLAGLLLMHQPWPFFLKANPSDFQLALALVPVTVLSHTFLQLLTSIKQFGWFAVFSIAISIVQLGGCFLFIIFFNWGVFGALTATIVAHIFGIFLTLLFICSTFNFQRVRWSFVKLRRMFTYDLRHYAGKVSNQINVQSAPLVLALFATQEEIGLFAVAVSLTTRIIMIPDTLSTVLIPRIAADKLGLPKLVAECARLSGLLCAGVLVLLCIFAKPIVTFVFSPAFLPIIPLIRILALGVLLRCASKVFVPYLLGTNHPGIISISSGAGTLVNIAILLFLLPAFGLAGAAFAMVVGYLTNSFILAISFGRKSGMRHKEIWLLRRSDFDTVGSLFQQAWQKRSSLSSFLKEMYARH